MLNKKKKNLVVDVNEAYKKFRIDHPNKVTSMFDENGNRILGIDAHGNLVILHIEEIDDDDRKVDRCIHYSQLNISFDVVS